MPPAACLQYWRALEVELDLGVGWAGKATLMKEHESWVGKVTRLRRLGDCPATGGSFPGGASYWGDWRNLAFGVPIGLWSQLALTLDRLPCFQSYDVTHFFCHSFIVHTLYMYSVTQLGLVTTKNRTTVSKPFLVLGSIEKLFLALGKLHGKGALLRGPSTNMCVQLFDFASQCCLLWSLGFKIVQPNYKKASKQTNKYKPTK